MRIDDPASWIPHRPPILTVDAVEVDEPGVKGRGMKKFAAGDPWLTGHFPGNPVVPGVAMIEGAAQTAAIVLLAARGKGGGGFLADVSKFRFKAPVIPPADVVFEITVAGVFGALCKVSARVLAGGVLAAEGELVLSASPA
jgi:3-hydroxyacyl-[acyl-carrier-protein] dehydratase